MLALNRDAVNAEAAEKEKTEEVVAKAEAPEAAPAVESQDVQDPTIGSLSDKIALEAVLANPLRPDVISQKVDDKVDKVTKAFIVGYKFKALADMVVPDCGTTDQFARDYMNYADINGQKEVKAGEEFDLTPCEMAILACSKEVNKKFSGGRDVAVCCWAKKDMDKVEVTAKTLPRAVLRLQNGSIKDYPYINVVEKREELDENGAKRVYGVPVPGYDKFASLCNKQKRSAGVRASRSSKASSAPTYDPSCARFMDVLRQKGMNR